MKKLLYILLGLLLLVVIAIGAIVAFINPNDFKPLIADEVKKATGRELVIDGDISWRFWPTLGLSVEQLAFKNPQGFAEPDMLKLDKAELSVAVMPLLSDTLDVGLVSLHGARVFVQTLPNGVSNLDGLSGDAADAAPAETPVPASNASSPAQAPAANWTISIGGLELLDASATVRDDKTDTQSEISKLNLTIGKLETGVWVPIEFDVEGKQNALAFSAKGDAEAMIDKEIMKSQLRALTLEATASDAQTQLESISLKADRLGLGIPMVFDFSAKGKASDMAFEASGETTAQVDEAVSLITASGLSLETTVSGASLPRPEMKISVGGDVSFDNKAQTLSVEQLKAAADELDFDGKASVALADIPAIRFDVHSPSINLDTFPGGRAEDTEKPVSTGGEGNGSGGAEKAGAKKPLSDVEPDLSALKGLDIAGKITIDDFVANNVQVAGVVADFAVNRGKATLRQFDAKLYDGTIKATGSLDATVSPARYQVKKDIQGVNVLPLLKAAANQDILSGRGSIDVNVSGVGLSEKRLRTGITGTVAINFADGAINGINIPEMIREAKATLKGQRAEYVEETRKTDFSALTATFNLGKGIASTRNLKMEAPALRVRSEGQSNLVKEDLDFDVFVSVVGTSKGQGGKDIDELKDVTIPVSIGGTWAEPSYKLDVKSLLASNKVLEEKARKEAERGLKKLLGDKAEDDKVKQVADQLLKGLFN